MTSYWAEQAHLPGGITPRVRLSVDAGVITGVEAKVNPRPEDVRLDGVVLPGFANGHSHAFHRALRGRTHGNGGNFWSWREQMYAVTARLTPETYFDLAFAVFAEMALAGFTVVGEFHYLHHAPGGKRYDAPNAMGEALIAAAELAGVRLTLLDGCYLAGGLAGTGHLPLDEVQRRFSDGDVETWAARVSWIEDTPMMRVGAAAHSVRAVPRESLGLFAEAVGDRVVHAHVSEQFGEHATAALYYGRTPTELLDDAGLLSPRFTAVHCNQVTATDVARLGSASTNVCVCPTTERDLADGIGPSRPLHDAGVRLCIGSDQHAIIDPFEELRGLEMHERILTGERGRFTPDELLEAGTAAGYAALGWPEGGTIQVGKLADFIAVRPDSVRTAGCRPNQLLFSAAATDVRHVVVHGEHIVEDGLHRAGDVAAHLTSALKVLREAPA